MPVYINYSFIKRVSQKWRWAVVVIYTLTIYISLPFGPTFWRFVLRQWGNSINYLGWFLVFVSGAYFLIYLIFRREEKKPSVYIAFFFISLACLAILKYMCCTGAERLHLLMYGILSCIVFWALKNEVKKTRVYLYTTILAFSLGLTDEIIQGFLPMRVFDVKDILMNWLSSGMGELFIAFVLEPDINPMLPKRQAAKQ
ncbi:MAG: VanZ family protein [Planctomycetota bacterium]|nr:VanZ family protein [Planctomycetota bacterium]MDE1889550.1 VanZ family protein [Planctomycetota bacterium]MDE2216686.1 VanZ family protein [Planctomycetota bacterium]